MNITTGKDADISEAQVWLTAWIAVAACDTCRDMDSPARWADKCLNAFRERFVTEDDDGE